MESGNLHLNVDYVGSSGIILSPERKAALQTSLVILQNENKFNKVYFWGKIVGVSDDYYIAQGVYKDEFVGKRTFYSKDCIRWGLLQPATEEMRAQSEKIQGRFSGDPSFEYEYIRPKKVGDTEDEREEEETVTVKEEDRLSATISKIDENVCIVPRGAYIKVPTGQTVRNRSFEGLTVSEAAKLCNYMHFRQAILLPQKPLLIRANLDKAVDFMDNLEDDIPQSSWSLQFERGSGLVTLRSLLWPGYVFYHVPGTRSFGSVYFGSGEMNLDLPFML